MVPFKSKAQERWMYSQHPEMAKRWAAHTPKSAKLPEHVKKDRTRRNSGSNAKRAIAQGV